MTSKTWLFEGQTPGTGVTGANSDDFGDPALGTGNIGAGSSIVYSNAQAAHGSMCVQFNTLTGVFLYYSATGFNSNDGTMSVYLYFTQAPTQQTPLFQWRNATVGALQLEFTTSRTWVLIDTASGVAWTGSVAVPLNQWIRLDWSCRVATSVTGESHFKWFSDKEGTTAADSHDLTTINAGTTVLASLRFGKLLTTSNWTTTFYLDTLRVEDGTIALKGPYAPLSSAYDPDYADLVAAGYTGSLSDMRRQSLLSKLSLASSTKSNNDLELDYWRGQGKTGSLQDARHQP